MPNLKEAESIIAEYCSLMEEIKHRNHVINIVASGKLADAIPPRAAEELCYLQLRMICELIALGSLVAHGDIKATRTRKLSKRYEADWILKTMDRLHPNFYPRPSRQIHDTSGKVKSIEPIASGFLTRPELSKLYHECGGALHRGTLESVLSGKAKKRPDFKRILSWMERIVTLLNHHQIALIDATHEYWIIMHAEQDGKVHGFLMKEIAVGK